MGLVAVMLVREDEGQSAYKHALNCGDGKMHERKNRCFLILMECSLAPKGLE